jgi:hypothetical protein
MAAGERAAKTCSSCSWFRPGPGEGRAGRCGLAVIRYPIAGEGRRGVTVQDSRFERCGAWQAREGGR